MATKLKGLKMCKISEERLKFFDNRNIPKITSRLKSMSGGDNKLYKQLVDEMDKIAGGAEIISIKEASFSDSVYHTVATNVPQYALATTKVVSILTFVDMSLAEGYINKMYTKHVDLQVNYSTMEGELAVIFTYTKGLENV